jgi:hypothetical protein
MRFVRKHSQQNIIKDDKFIQEKPEKEIIEPEIFENVMRFNINTADWSLNLVEGDKHSVDEIIETANYFTIIANNRRNMNCIKYSEVINYEFYL